MKHLPAILVLYFLSLLVCAAAHSQDAGSSEPFFAQSFRMIKFNYAKAYIVIDDKESTYSDLLKLNDSDLLKVELYPPKKAVRYYGKDLGSNGIILFTTRKIKEKPGIITTEDSALYYSALGFSVHIKGLIYPTLDGDTTYKAWIRFLQKNLHADTPTERGAPMGLYKVMVQFAVNEEGGVLDVSVAEDPGYGTKSEVMRLMHTSPPWQPGTYKGKTVKCYQRQPVTFQVVEM